MDNVKVLVEACPELVRLRAQVARLEGELTTAQARLDCGKDTDCADEIETQVQCLKHYESYAEQELAEALEAKEGYAAALDRLQKRFNEVWAKNAEMAAALRAKHRPEHAEGCDFHKGGLYICTCGIFRKANEMADAALSGEAKGCPKCAALAAALRRVGKLLYRNASGQAWFDEWPERETLLSGEGKVWEAVLQVVEWCKTQKAINVKQAGGHYPSHVGDCPSCGYHGPVNDSGNIFRHRSRAALAAMKGE